MKSETGTLTDLINKVREELMKEHQKRKEKEFKMNIYQTIVELLHKTNENQKEMMVLLNTISDSILNQTKKQNDPISCCGKHIVGGVHCAKPKGHPGSCIEQPSDILICGKPLSNEQDICTRPKGHPDYCYVLCTEHPDCERRQGHLGECLPQKIIQDKLNLKPKCDISPAGWECPRQKGHDGPCAAIPTGNVILLRWIDHNRMMTPYLIPKSEIPDFKLYDNKMIRYFDYHTEMYQKLVKLAARLGQKESPTKPDLKRYQLPLEYTSANIHESIYYTHTIQCGV